MRAWLFPGQGAQRAGMGLDLLARFPAERAVADRVLGYSITESCAGGVPDHLRLTEYVQPAMFVVAALHYRARIEDEASPDFLAGHSLGELVALWAAGCFDFETGLRLVKSRGALMGQASGGTMAAVVGLPEDAVTRVLTAERVDGVDVANRNAPDQTVLSGRKDAIDSLEGPLRAAGGRVVPLNVSAAFHSRFMRAAADGFAEKVSRISFAPPRIPVIANVTAAPYPANGIGDLLVRQLVSPVRWRESMRELAARGTTEVAEVGPGTVLTKLWQACAPDRISLPADTAPVAEERLGSAAFRRDFGVKYAYLAGSMYRGIASTDLVVRIAQAGLLGFFGAGGLSLPAVEAAIRKMRSALGDSGRFGMNLLHDVDNPAAEDATVDLYLRHDIRFIEAAAYTGITPALARFRFTGAHRGPGGRPVAPRRVVAKVSRPETAAAFMSPAPEAVLAHLVRGGLLTAAEAEIARLLPVSEDVCVEADSGGHTDGGVALTLVPTIARLRDKLTSRFAEPVDIRVGAAGGLGTPEAVAAVFVLGADFVVTGSVNQCSVEAGTSDLVKDMLADLDVQDTAYAPAGDMFELGAKVQVVRKGTLFAARANRLYQIYRNHGGLDELDHATQDSLERTTFGRSLDEVWQLTCDHYLVDGREAELERITHNPKRRMASVFRWYFADSTMAAMEGRAADKVNFQVHCGPAMGAFNRFADGGPMASWRDRRVADIAEALMSGAASRLR